MIVEKTGLSGSWLGLALLATVTSLPELVTGISSVAAAHETDIAVGDVLGSCVFNLLILALPEITVTLAALRMGAIDMAIANLLGSNLFNIAILAVDDVFYLPGPLLAHVSPVHAVTALAAIAMSTVVVIGLLTRPRGRIGDVMSWPGLALVAIYLLNSYALYFYGG